MKQNDWIVATLNNPEFTAADFRNILNLSLDNTLLLSKDDYLKSSFITENNIFKNDDGTFNKDKFTTFYNEQSKKFADFQQESAIDNYTYGFWDTARTANSKVDSPNIGVDLVLNPEHRSIGVIGQGMLGERDFSDMELAQQLKIFDFTNLKTLDYSANEASLFENPIRFFKELFSEPLVLATYDLDKDSINPITGLMEHHFKGEKKLNAAGEYYLETLGDRSILGKQVLSMGDIVTSDTSAINKYDFFDSDGLDKNPTGVIAKNLAAVAPMLFLGPVGSSIYGGLYVVREMSKTLPMLYRLANILSDDTSDSKLANMVAAYGAKFTGGTSDYAKENTFSFENFGNLISDVALQWSQQQVIANSIARLGGSQKTLLNGAKAKAMKEYEKQSLNLINRAERGEALDVLQYTGGLNRNDISTLIKNGNWGNTVIGQAALRKVLPEVEKLYAKRLKFGQDLSLAYMALISNADVYDSFIEHGATKKEAAAFALGSTLGMFVVDKYLHLGEMFFDDATAASRRLFRQTLTRDAELLASKINTLGNVANDTKKNYLGLIKQGMDAAKKAIKNFQYRALDRDLGILGKSLGEGLEEVTEELVTDLTKSLYELANKFGYFTTNDVGAWDNARDRYLMSLFGGAIGGAMFGGVEAIKNPKSASDKETQATILKLVAEGKTNEVLDYLTKMRDRGELNSKELSIDTEDGVFLTADEKHQSQNDFVYETMKRSILLMEAIVNGNQLNLTDELLFEKMVLSDAKMLALKDALEDKSYITGYFDDYFNLVNDIYNIEKDIDELEKSTLDPDKRNSEEYLEKMLELLTKKEEIKQQIDDFKSGKYVNQYIEKMLFAMNPEISGSFLSMNFSQFVRNQYNKDASKLTSSEEVAYREAWENYNKTQRKLDFDEAFKLYKDISKKINPVLQELNEMDLTSWKDLADKLEEHFPTNFFKSFRDIDDTEIEGIETLTPEEVLAKKQELANLYNNDNIVKFIENFLNKNSIIDLSSYRRLHAILNTRRRDIVTHNILERIRINNVDNSTLEKLKEVLGRLNDDFSNLSVILDELKAIIKKDVAEKINTIDKVQFIDDIVNPIDRENITLDEYNKNYYSFLLLLDLFLENDELKNREITLDDILENYSIYVEGELLNDLIEAHKLQINPSPESSAKLQELNDKYQTPEYSYSEENGMINAILVGQSNLEKLRLDAVRTSTQSLYESIDTVINDIKNDSLYKSLTDAKKKLTFDHDPTLILIKSIANKLGENFDNIENTLQSIYEQYERLENIDDYLLSDELIKALEKAKEYMDIASGFITASSLESNYFHILPFYKTFNEFNRTHSSQLENVEDLPELNIDTANVSRQSLNRYKKEIDSWITKSKANSLNKIKEFNEFNKKFNKVLLLFLRDNRDGFGEKLIEGIDSIDFDRQDALFELSKLLHYNYKKNGFTTEELISIFKKVIPNFTRDNDNLIYQMTSNLDSSINPDNFTEYDKMNLLLTILSEDPVEFYTWYKEYINSSPTNSEGLKIAPLTALRYNIMLAHAREKNYKFFNDVYRSVLDELGLSVSYLPNTTIITGVGGAGKTQVVIRALASGENIWFSGPSDTQINNLLSINSKASGKTKLELFNEILESGEYDTIMNEYNSASNGNKVRVFNKTLVLLKLDNIKFKKPETPPDRIIIDEATLFNSAELQLISNWAEKFGVQVTYVGDENQNGDKNYGNNLEPEYIFAFRTPRLATSLRQANYWKYINQLPLESTLNRLRAAHGALFKSLLEEVKKELKNYKLHYYFLNGTLTGDMIVDSLNNDHIESLNGTIAYIGETNTETYLKLKNSGKNFEVLNPKQVQGGEFDYVVIDKDFKNSKDIPSYILDLYTMITRSKKGAIIIDNGLTSNIGGVKEENYTTNAITLNPQAVDEFIKTELQFLDSLDLTPRTIPTPEPKVTPKPVTNIIETVDVEPEEPEIIGKLDNDEELLEEKKKSESIIAEPISKYPFNCYSNISFTGLDVITDKNGKEIWASNGSLRDLDIFLNGTELLNSKDQIKYTYRLLSLKSFIQFGGEYLKLHREIRDLFNKKDFDNIEYFLVSEDKDISKHHLLRKYQGLTDDKISFIKDSKGIDLVLSMQARITSSKTGKTYTITMGSLESLEGSLKSKKILMDLIRRENPSITDTSTEANKIINAYDSGVKKLVDKKEIKINSPYFTRTTGLRKADSKYRLKDLVVQDDTQLSAYDYATFGYVTSPVYTIVEEEELKKLGLSRSLLGKPIMYVSSNTNLNPLDLAQIYSRLKADPENHTPEVRCNVLNTEGVSFESLLRLGYSRKHYLTKVSADKTFTLPFTSLAMGVRMYTALWNFRAGLTTFNEAIQNTFGSNLDEIDRITKLETALYNEARNRSGKYLNEQEFRQWIKDNSPDQLNDLKKLWDFNDNIKDNLFKLGYSSLDGAYIRRSNGKNYVYINRDLAKKYQLSILNLFENVLDGDKGGLIPPITKEIRTFIDKKATWDDWKSTEENWVRSITNGGTMVVSTSDGRKISYNFGAADRIRFLPTLLKLINLNLLYRQYDPEAFEQDMLEEESNYALRIGDKVINYTSIFTGSELFEDGTVKFSDTGIVNNKPVGSEAYNLQTGEGLIDKRLINMFNLAFHGVPNTRLFNDLTTPGLLKSDFAVFPNGFYVDTFIPDEHIDGANKDVLTDKTFYSTDSVPTGPMIKFSFDEVSTKPTKVSVITNNNNTLISSINSTLGTGFNENLSEEKLINLLNLKMGYNTKSIFEQTITLDKLDNIIVDYELKDGKIEFFTLRQKLEKEGYPNIIELKNISKTQYEFTTLLGNKYYLQSDGMFRYIIQELKPETKGENNQGSTVRQILDYIISKVELDEDSREILENDKNIKSSIDNILDKNIIKQMIRKLDFGDEDINNELLKAIDTLEQNSGSNCTHIIK